MKEQDFLLIFIFIVLLLVVAYVISAKGEKRKLVLVNTDGAKVELTVEAANTIATQLKGLMGRKSLGEDEGMLFVFDKSAYHSFWMFNTTIPLDAIHIAEDGTVVDIIEMAPCGLDVTACKSYSSKAPAKYVLEVNQGFSKRHSIQIGKTKADIPSFKKG